MRTTTFFSTGMRSTMKTLGRRVTFFGIRGKVSRSVNTKKWIMVEKTVAKITVWLEPILILDKASTLSRIP